MIIGRLIGKRIIAAAKNLAQLRSDFFAQALLARFETGNLRVIGRNRAHLIKLGLNHNQLVLQLGYQAHLHFRLSFQIKNAVLSAILGEISCSLLHPLFSHFYRIFRITDGVFARTRIELIDQIFALLEQSLVDFRRLSSIERGDAQCSDAGNRIEINADLFHIILIKSFVGIKPTKSIETAEKIAVFLIKLPYRQLFPQLAQSRTRLHIFAHGVGVVLRTRKTGTLQNSANIA